MRRVWIPKLGSHEKRPLGIPTVQDRVVQAALLQVMEPIFERDFAEQSYGFRPNRGCKDALRRVCELLGRGHIWVVDADLKSYFDTIPSAQMIGRLEEKVSDGRVIEMLRQYLNSLVQIRFFGSRPGGPKESSPGQAKRSPGSGWQADKPWKGDRAGCRPSGARLSIIHNPGLRFACPGLLSFAPPARGRAT